LLNLKLPRVVAEKLEPQRLLAFQLSHELIASLPIARHLQRMGTRELTYQGVYLVNIHRREIDHQAVFFDVNNEVLNAR
jgi:hypothetical protein